jgi:hypothetical protein
MKKQTLNEEISRMKNMMKKLINEDEDEVVNKSSKFEYDVEDFGSNDWGSPEKGYDEFESNNDIDYDGDFYNTYDDFKIKDAKIFLYREISFQKIEKVLEIPLNDVSIPKGEQGHYSDNGYYVEIMILKRNKEDYLTPEMSNKIYSIIETIKNEGNRYRLFLALNLTDDEVDKYINSFSQSYDDTQGQERRMGA